jgi:hypothetical protein
LHGSLDRCSAKPRSAEAVRCGVQHSGKLGCEIAEEGGHPGVEFCVVDGEP